MNYLRNTLRILWIAVIAIMSLSVHAGDKKTIGDQYPLASCVVTETPLKRDALVFNHKGREIRTCCFDCEDDIKKDYDSWIRKIDDRIIAQQEPFYPLTVCVVDGTAFEGAGSLDIVYRNRLFLLCSFECEEKLRQAPGPYFEKLNQAVIRNQKPTYPLSKCIISGLPLGEQAIDHVVGNQLVRLAGSEQLHGFDENPGKHLAELRKLKKKPAAAKKGSPESGN